MSDASTDPSDRTPTPAPQAEPARPPARAGPARRRRADRDARDQDRRGQPGDDAPGPHVGRGAQPRVGSVLRLPEGVQLDPADLDVEAPEDETMILNLGPSHPSTHGVLRVMVELDGETVLRSKPVIGYLHTGHGEDRPRSSCTTRAATNVTRMDYLSPFFNELGFCLSVEKLLGVEVPPRATWIRMLMCELNRISSHFLWLATNGADLGAINMLVYGWREREMVLAFFEKVTGLRMNHNYIRPGGVAADLPDGWRDDVLALCEAIPRRMDEYDNLLTGQPILQNRLQGVGPARRRHGHRPRPHRPAAALDRGGLGPAAGPALPGLRRRRLRRDRRDPGRLLGPLRHPVQRDPRVDQDRPPDRRPDAGRATSGPRTRRSPRRPAAASTSRWKP